MAARAGLRHILAAYLELAPRLLEIVEGQHGKPRLPGGPHFSLSHSGELALCAVSRSREVGVDLEQLRPVPEAEGIVRKWFTRREQEAYFRALLDRPESAFFEAWTRKEAYLKALGTGLSGLAAREDVDPGRWEAHQVLPARGYVGTLVQELAAAPGTRD